MGWERYCLNENKKFVFIDIVLYFCSRNYISLIKTIIIMRKFIYYGVLIVLLTMFGNLSMAQLSVGVLDQTYTVDFDNTVEGVNNGTFAGIGFNPNPAEGQIDSDAVKVFGLSDSPMMNFGDTQEAGDFARGTTAGGVSTGGIYAGEYSSSPSDYFFMWQAGSSDMAAGMIMLKVQNNTGEEVTSVEIAYDILCLNDQGRSNSVMFYWSDDGATTYNQISELDYASPLAADASPVWTVTNKTTTISGLSIAAGEEILLIWGTDDVGGSGSRDELGLDNIDVKLLPEANITITYPTSPETFYANSSVTVTWTSVGVSNDVGLAVGPEGGLEGDFSFIGSTLASNGEFQLDIPNGVQFTDYVIIVYSDDNPDIYDITAAFDVVDNAGPNISETFPPNLGNEVAVFTELVINFDEDIALGTGNITIKYMADDAVFETLDVTGTQVNIGSEGDVLNIIPTTDLDFNTNFYVEIDNGAIEDLFGNSFAGITGNAIWSFTTEEEPIIIGSDCSNPIIVNIPEYAPYEELEQTTCGMLDTYSNTCLNSYDGGEDIIYLLDVSTASYVYIEMVPSVTYTGMALLDDCPDVGNCIESVTNSNSSPRIIETQLEPGTYYLMIDIWPTPDCFEFDLTIDVISCPNPSNLQEIAVSESSVTIGWDAGGLETNWEVQYGNQGFLIGEGDIVSVATNPETTISGLQGASTYDFYVRADCGGGDFSEWIGPITASTECGVINSFTYNQDFENAGDIPVCWVNDPDDGGGEWNFVTSNSHAASADHSDPGEYYAHVNAFLINTSNNPINLISPVFDITSGDFKLVYYAWIGADSETNPLYIDISTDGGATWTEGVYTHDHSIVNQWFEVEVPLTAYTSSELVVRFRGISNYGSSMCNFGIDDVSIQEISTATPDWCNLQWPATMDINEGGTGTVYAQVYEPGVTDAVGQGAGIEAWIGYSEDDTDPATWTNWVPATYNSDNGNNDEYMADLGPLPIGTYYYASRFILDNGPDVYGGYSATGGGFWNGIDFVNGVLNVNAAVLTLPLFEDFELGFTYFANPAKSTDWTLNTTVYYSEVQSAHNAYAAYDDNVLYQTGNIDLTSTNNPELSFWQIAKTEGGYDYCYVEISTDGGATWNIIPETAYLGAGDYSSESFDEDSYTEWGTYTETPDNTWWKKEVFSLADYISNNEIRVRFRLTSDSGAQRAGWYIDDISIKDVTCPNPTDLAVNNIMATEADVSWTAGDTETLWNILYGPQGFDIGTEGTLISGVGNPYTLVSLTENTPYDVYVQADCSGGDLSDWVGPVSFTTLASCPEPTDLTAANIGLTTADLSWTAALGTDTWNAEVGAVGFTPGNSEELFSDIGNTTAVWQLSGLTEDTDYQLYVQTDCGGGTTSTWAGPYDFSTSTPGGSCETAFNYGTVNDPEVTGTMEEGGFVWYYVTLAEDYGNVDISLCGSDFDTKLAVFEDCADFVSFPSWGAPDGNLAYNDDAPNYYCSTDLNQSLVEFDVLPAGTYYILVYPYGSNSGTYGLEITGVTCLQPTDLTAGNITQTSAEISWTQGLNETLWNVLYGPTGFDILTEGTQVDGVTSPYEINSLTENTPYDVYVQSDCGSGDYSEWAGPVTFTTLAACAAPINLYAANITSESADLGWEAVGGTDTWNVEVGLPGFTPGNGEELVLITETNDNPVFVDGGTPNTEYAFYVQSVCGAETSDWAGPYEFSTTCGVFSVPYFEGFEDDVNFACWTILDIDGDGYGWSINTQDSYEGSQGVRSRWNSGGNDDWLISPQLAIDADNYALEFFAKSQSSSMLEDFEVLVSTTGTAPADFTNVLEVVTEHPNEWVKHLYKLSDYGINSGDNIYIAIHHTSIDEYYLHVDAFHVRALNEGNDIIDFVLAEQTGAANITGAPDYTVEVEVAMGTNLTELTPTITVSPEATIIPESGVPQDFSAPVVYTVTSEAGTEQEWTVNVTEATTLSSENDIVDFVIPEQTGAAVIMGDPDYTVEIEVVWNADIANLTPTIVVSPLATISPESGVTQDFTNPVVYTVTAEDGTEQEWTVTVTQEEAPAGIFCDNPIVVSIPAEAPYLDEDQSNCGFGANYTETCLGSYDNGDGIVYRLDVTEASYVYIDLTTTTTWTGIALLDDCPDVGECITYVTGSGGNESIEAALMPGSYYILISTWPTPNCIPSFDLAITVDNNVCIAPINLAVVDLWQDEVTIEWEAGFLETSFNVLYGEAGFDPDTEGTLISGVTSPYTISDLISETEYDVYVQADCDSDWASITFTTLAACPAPIELYATNITSESAELGWNAVGGTDTWNVEYGVAGFTQGEGTLISATNDNPVFVDGLTPATTYEFYVQADCGTEQSIWVGPYAFFTECADAVLPIYQDFEDDSYLCWTAISNNAVNGPGGSGYYPMGIYFEDETETNKVLLFSSFSSATDYNQYLITPELPANAGLDISFDYAQGSSSSSGEVFRVGYSTTTSDLAEFTWGDEIVTVDTDIHEYIDVLPANTKFVAINYYSDYQYYLAVDNISISEIQLEDPTIAEIDVYTEVEDANVCLGALESEALDQLVDEITISDSDGGEHVVTVSWTIDSYNGDVADTYTATGTFELPTGVVQTDPETTLEVYADVVVNELPVVTCPDDFTVTTLDPVEISGESPQGGVYAGTGVTNGIFDPNGLENDNYVITYTYQDPTTGCENECEFTITLNYVGIETSSLAEISIYPNPNKGVFVMDLSNIEGKVYYQIYDTKGSVIISNEFVNYGGVEEFNLDVAPGIYYIQLRNAEQTINKKIVVH